MCIAGVISKARGIWKIYCMSFWVCEEVKLGSRGFLGLGASEGGESGEEMCE